ncbi:SDR family oxidoreductase [Egicoccus halophilus]|uniref:Short-chain dehydrogenase n=1 Tax=Egicoccus halophilus TaxID=1670830 RepID=A0A8J3A4X1_9ACTN|nr:SDR family oxidoreductase [Egicoccus halophilus]GGI02844.1 short-chain dehydrogenase [Egicoccus halophilus]
MRTKLQDAVVVVTGASSGIGRATAEALVRAGSTVVAVARREDALRELADGFDAEARQRLVVEAADVNDAEALERVARDTVGRFGKLDAWVNNAAVNQYGRFEEVPLDEWRRVIETNLLGYAHGARAALPWFREQGHGTLVNVGSILSKVPAPLQSAYIASKFGIRGLTESLRQELQDAKGIRLSLIMPGPIDTPLFQHAANHTGWRVKPPEPTVDAARVAAAIVKNVVKPRREVPVSAATRPALLAYRLFPGLTERAAAKPMMASHLTDEAEEPTSGNLFEPVSQGTSVSGGWKPSRAGKPGRTLALVGGTGAAVVTALVWKRRAA